MGDTQQQHVSGNNVNRAPIYGRLLSMRRKTLFLFLTAQKDLPHEKLRGSIVRIPTLQMKKLRPAGEGVGLGLQAFSQQLGVVGVA